MKKINKALLEEAVVRRIRVAKEIKNDSIFILYGSKIKNRNSDVDFIFYQNSNLWYLLPLDEPEVILVICKINNQVKQLVFCNSKNNRDLNFYEKYSSSEDIKEFFNIEEVYYLEESKRVLLDLVARVKYVYLDSYDDRGISFIKEIKRNKRVLVESIFSVDKILAGMRVIKSELEINTMQTAANRSADAFVDSMKKTKSFNSEYEIAANIEFYCKMQGSTHMAYPTIAASGSNAKILHYTKNNCQLKNGDLLLVDAGCEYDYYASDISRTWPNNGVFSPVQKDIYDSVLNAQKDIIAAIKPGVEMALLQEIAIKSLSNSLHSLGVCKERSVDKIISSCEYRKFYMHSCSHFLGLDVHDVGKYKDNNKSSKLKEGMVITVEPGLYFGENQNLFSNHCVRIEDDVVVTKTGSNILSKTAPKEIEDIESILN